LLLECLSTTIQRYSIRKYSFQETFSRKSYKLLDSAFQTNLTSKIFHKSELPLQTKEIKSTCTKLLNRPAFRKMHWLLGATPQHLWKMTIQPYPYRFLVIPPLKGRKFNKINKMSHKKK
jgi:hypothetical protein